MEAQPGMEYLTFAGAGRDALAFQSSLPLDSPDPRRRKLIILIHGFSGSSNYFKYNFEALSAKHWVVAPDLRGHGRSAKTQGRYHVACLAADLQCLVNHLRASLGDDIRGQLEIVPVGCSIGAAVLWTYAELFGDSDFSGFVFADQAPLQDVSAFPLDDPWDRAKSHNGCYNETTMLAAQQAWAKTPNQAHRGLVQECLGYRFSPVASDDQSPERTERDEEFFTQISALCDGQWLARLLADHTRYDHREAIDDITRPSLVIAGRRTGCFPLKGIEEVATRIARKGTTTARFDVFESGHWMFYEEPDRFNKAIEEFTDSCTR